MANKDEAKIGDGNVPITIDGKEWVLKPSYKACIALATNGDGLRSLISRCANLELDTIRRVVAEGLGRNPTDLAERLYATGLRNVSGPAINYLVILSNGGRPVPKEEDKEGPLDQVAMTETSSL